MPTRPILTPTSLALSAAAGLASAAVSAEHNPRLLRGLTVAMALGTGGAVTWAAAKGWRPERAVAESVRVAPSPEGPLPVEVDEPRTLPLPAALGLGAAAAAFVAGTGELGLRGQAAVERWAERTTGHPRLVAGLAAAGVYLVTEALDRALDSPDDAGGSADLAVDDGGAVLA